MCIWFFFFIIFKPSFSFINNEVVNAADNLESNELINKIELNSLNNVSQEHIDSLKKGKSVIFLKKTKSFILSVKPQNITESTNFFFNKNIPVNGIHKKNYKKNKFLNLKSQHTNDKNLEWVEYFFHDKQTDDNYNLLPLSPCQSQEFGKDGSVSFSYSVTNGKVFSYTHIPSFEIDPFIFTFSINLFLDAKSYILENFSGSVSCILNSGLTGRIYLHAKYIHLRYKSRFLDWVHSKKKFEIITDFRDHDPLKFLKKDVLYQIECVTDDLYDVGC